MKLEINKTYKVIATPNDDYKVNKIYKTINNSQIDITDNPIFIMQEDLTAIDVQFSITPENFQEYLTQHIWFNGDYRMRFILVDRGDDIRDGDCLFWDISKGETEETAKICYFNTAYPNHPASDPNALNLISSSSFNIGDYRIEYLSNHKLTIFNKNSGILPILERGKYWDWYDEINEGFEPYPIDSESPTIHQILSGKTFVDIDINTSYWKFGEYNIDRNRGNLINWDTSENETEETGHNYVYGYSDEQTYPFWILPADYPGMTPKEYKIRYTKTSGTYYVDLEDKYGVITHLIEIS